MNQYIRRLIFLDGKVEDGIHWEKDRDVIVRPAFIDGKHAECRFVFNCEMSDRDGIATFVEQSQE